MRHYFASWVVVLSAISCGGSSETADFSSAGSSSGGTSSGGTSSAGSSAAGSAGKASGGSTSGGTSSAGSTSGGTGTSGSTGQAGTASGGGGTGSGGTGTVDPNCPPLRPMGTCDDAGTSCQYDYTNCLCYPTAPGTFIQCQKVDPACTGLVQAAPFEGTGGVSAKIALPPRQVCTCTAGNWMCAFGG
jgi:hypothetical protein